MNYFEASAALKKHGVSPVYLICGEETYLAEKLQLEILKKALPDATLDDAIVFNGEVAIEQIVQQINEAPFFTEKNMIFIKNSPLFKEKKKRRRKIQARKSWWLPWQICRRTASLCSSARKKRINDASCINESRKLALSSRSTLYALGS